MYIRRAKEVGVALPKNERKSKSAVFLITNRGMNFVTQQQNSN